MGLTPEQKKIRDAKKAIKGFRSTEEVTRIEAPSRSTGIRNVYKGGYEALARVEAILNEK